MINLQLTSDWLRIVIVFVSPLEMIWASSGCRSRSAIILRSAPFMPRASRRILCFMAPFTPNWSSGERASKQSPREPSHWSFLSECIVSNCLLSVAWSILMMFPLLFSSLCRYNEAYTWTNPTCCVHNIIVGQLWIEQYGNVEVINHK